MPGSAALLRGASASEAITRQQARRCVMVSSIRSFDRSSTISLEAGCCSRNSRRADNQLAAELERTDKLLHDGKLELSRLGHREQREAIAARSCRIGGPAVGRR